MRDGGERDTHFLAYFQPFCVVVVEREKVLWDFLSARNFEDFHVIDQTVAFRANAPVFG
jgi:hypothetical protein